MVKRLVYGRVVEAILLSDSPDRGGASLTPTGSSSTGGVVRKEEGEYCGNRRRSGGRLNPHKPSAVRLLSFAGFTANLADQGTRSTSSLDVLSVIISIKQTCF